MSEHWEKIIENEVDFYLNIKSYEDDLLDKYYKSQYIRYPVTVFDEDLGRVFLSGPNTEQQALYRIEMKECIEKLLKRAYKRAKRLIDAINQLEDQEQDVFWSIFIDREVPEMPRIREFGYRTRKEFIEDKTRILKKVYSFYEKERAENVEEQEKQHKEKLKIRVSRYNQEPKQMIRVGE